MAPISIINELISVQSALNMRVFENTIMTQETMLSETYWGEHAMEHLNNVIQLIYKAHEAQKSQSPTPITQFVGNMKPLDNDIAGMIN